MPIIKNNEMVKSRVSRLRFWNELRSDKMRRFNKEHRTTKVKNESSY